MVTIDQFVRCPLCGADDYKIKYHATWKEFASKESIKKENGKDKPAAESATKRDVGFFCCTSSTFSNHGNIVRCCRCGMLYNNPQPNPEALEEAYKNVVDPTYLEETAAREATFRLSLRQMHKYIQPPGSLLDIGCYTGAFIKTAHEAGWRTSGTELSVWAAQKAKELNIGPVYSEPPRHIPCPPNSFDAITLWDVIEHLTQPGELLSTIHGLLKPGGIFAFSTHRADCLAAWILGTKYPFFMDMHVSHFTGKTIRRILNMNGFELLAIKPHRRVLRAAYFFEKLAERAPMGKKLLPRIASSSWIQRRNIRINLLGLINVFARKIPETAP